MSSECEGRTLQHDGVGGTEGGVHDRCHGYYGQLSGGGRLCVHTAGE
jgi:hypothetical protein